MLDHPIPAAVCSDRILPRTTVSRRGNLLLESLGVAVHQRLQGRVRGVATGEVLSDVTGWSLDVYFPHAGTAISLLRATDEGPELEVGMIGAEGFGNLDSVLSRDSYGDTAAVMRRAGEVTCISAQRLRAEFASDSRTRALITDYAAIFLEQVSQSALCNGVHTVAQRLSKWLLMLRDRTGSNDLAISHESLSRILGIHRPAVTLAIGALADARVIDHGRKFIHVREAVGLQGYACGCFESMNAGLSRFRARLENRRE